MAPPGGVTVAPTGSVTVALNTHVLVVEDEPNVRLQVCAWLRHEGHRYVAVAGSEEALEQIDHEPPAVVLLNTRLAGGRTLVHDLRAGQRDLAFVMMHRLSDEGDVPRLEPGVVGYVFKPLVQREVMESVSDALAWHAVAHRGLIERTQTEEEMARRGLALGEALAVMPHGTVSALETTLAPFVRGYGEVLRHAGSVATWALAMGQVVGVPEPALTRLECGAFCHDIGKLALPAGLLRKFGPLSRCEFDLIRTHPDVGHDILMMSPALRESAPVVLGAHERVDGSGFPRGLQGDAIPIGARITAVADAARTLIESRPYRDPKSLGEVGAELVRRSGAWFDSDVVAVWLRVAEARRD